MKPRSRMSEQRDDRWARWSVWIIIGLTIAERAWLLTVFGFRYIGIDDALIQQVAIDYGHGVFREPYLYGQNYNPMLEALLAAPFVRWGTPPWIILPAITSLLALLPFWSWGLFALKRRAVAAAVLLCGLPLILPLEWGLITTMPRGWVHGLALLAPLPWILRAPRTWLRHALAALFTVAAVLLNANALPLAAGAVIWLVSTDARKPTLWISLLAASLAALVLHTAAQDWYAAHPGSIIHPLLASDIIFDPRLLWDALVHLRAHLLHMHPFGSMTGLAVLLVVAAALVLLRRGEWRKSIAILAALGVMLLALGLPKLHEGCDSIFFPQSRLLLGLPLLIGAASGLVLNSKRIPRNVLLTGLSVAALLVTFRSTKVQGIVNREMALQECAWVREEPITEVRLRCDVIAETAMTHGCDLIVPLRWPGIKVDHRAHFAAHLTCYACPQLSEGFPEAYGAGYDRRSWIREAHERPAQGRVLFVGGDPEGWRRAEAIGYDVEDVSIDGLLMHIARCDTVAPSAFITCTGVDDDLGH